VIDISLKNIAEINIHKLKNNVKSIRKRVGQKTKICAVVKANAYGHGACGLATRIQSIVDFFAVALLEECVDLYLAGVKKPILVLLPVGENQIERALRYGARLTVASINDAFAINSVCERLNLTALVHVKVDTGMHRLGVSIKELPEFCSCLRELKSIRVEGCYSHLFEPTNKDKTEEQYANFIMAKNTVSEYFDGVIFHLSASGGILLNKKYHQDMVRAGLLLYGYKPFPSNALTVEPILKIKGKVLNTRSLKEGEPLLYGNYRLSEDTTASIVRVGYADGINRNNPLTLNSACMDVSAVKSNGDEEVTVFDNADLLAEANGTISYEVLCGITNRSIIEYKE